RAVTRPLYGYFTPHDTPSIPTRRSSDLKVIAATSITPNQVTFVSFLLTLISAIAFATGHPLIAGLIAQLSSIVDGVDGEIARLKDRKSTRLDSSHVKISYAVFCLNKNKR